MNDATALSSWIGREQETEELIAARPASAMAATLDYPPRPFRAGDLLPPAWHWVYFREIARQSDLGADGHAARGEFLPPIKLPRRMWAGNRLHFHQPLRIGDTVRWQSRITAVSEKHGRSGRLAFVTVHHRYSGSAGLALEEVHDIVYREAPRTDQPAPAPEPAPMAAAWRRVIAPTPVLLFRYSALTFNGHRIHYDLPYVTGVEGYPGLIVHGPLTATLLVDLYRREQPKAELRMVRFRARRPLFAGPEFAVEGAPTETGALLWALTPDGNVAMTAEIELA